MSRGYTLAWRQPLLSGLEHANFLETRATEYSKAATRGNWGEVWESLDRRQAAKTTTVANDADEGGDLLTGVAAE